MLIATWNVRTLYQIGKLDNVVLEMKRLDIDILGMSEVRWTGINRCKANDDYELIYSGGETHERGVGILLKKELGSMVDDIRPVSDRVIAIRIQTRPKPITIVQVYAPIADSTIEELETFYEDVEKSLKNARKDGPVFVMGDLNAKIGKGAEGWAIGEHGIGERNERGDRLVEYAVKNRMLVCNTNYSKHARRLYTWKSPGDMVRNQIDYIMINQRYKNMVLDCQTYPSADCGSDHVLLVAKCRLRMKKMKGENKAVDRIPISPINDRKVQKIFRSTVEQRIAGMKEIEDPREAWNEWKEVILKTAAETIPREKRRKNKPWMKNEILDMMDIRRSIADRDSYEYRRMNKEINRRCREAKQKWYEEKCQNMHKLEEENRTREMHNEIKSMMKEQKRKPNKIMIIENDQGEICSSKTELEDAWVDYIEQLYGDDNRREFEDTGEGEAAPDITLEELENAIRKAKNRKAVGIDKVPVDLIKCLDVESRKALLKIMNGIYKTGHMPDDFEISTFIPIPKKSSARKCAEYRTISIMSHALKLLLSIVNKRIENKIDKYLSETQFGFRQKRGTRDAIALFKLVIQRALAVDRKIFACFVDYEKAFDKVEHTRMLEILQKYGIDKEDLQIIKNLYKQQKANIRLGNSTTERFCNIRKGVRQGCPLSPKLFNVYAEEIMRHKSFIKCGLKINGERLNEICYADDKVLIAETPQQLQRMVTRLDKESRKYGMKINIDKTKIMMIEKEKSNRQIRIKIGDKFLEQVEKFKYLGTIISSDGRDAEETRTRIGMARSAFNNLERVLRDKSLREDLRRDILQCYVWSIASYASETWTINADTRKRIEAFEYWCYRRMKRIKWTEKITNKEVLKRMKITETVFLKSIQNKKRRYLQQRTEEDQVFARVIQGKIVGKPPRGRRRMNMLSGI